MIGFGIFLIGAGVFAWGLSKLADKLPVIIQSMPAWLARFVYRDR